MWLHKAPSDTTPQIDDTRPSDSWRILVVENKESEARKLTDCLLRHGHRTRTVGGGRAALNTYKESDLVLLDLDLPDLDGLEVCRLLRAASCVPVIVVSSRCTELDRVLGLRAGADDYMSKPYSVHELIARVEAVMRRTKKQYGPGIDIVSHGPLRIDPATRRVHLSGKSIKLTRKEFDLLHILASQPDQVVSRKYIMDQVWGGDWSQRTIDTHVSSIRRKLGDKNWIVTARGIGFQLGAAATDSYVDV
ncbi:response regulator transcription factor [Nocardiopsis sp. CNT312]|uniref:response regulator transcription factor n=1 Tax=Nocardiopsis sp. CNT312 TaxID=1137268 RepID=UPI001E580388|nr:response regulator transcription factor [Nocardiopsis sp. CNT312]